TPPSTVSVQAALRPGPQSLRLSMLMRWRISPPPADSEKKGRNAEGLPSSQVALPRMAMAPLAGEQTPTPVEFLLFGQLGSRTSVAAVTTCRRPCSDSSRLGA